jgi:hypothetical protein
MSDKFSPLPFSVAEDTRTEVVNYVDWIAIDKMNNLERRVVGLEVKLYNITKKLNGINEKLDRQFDLIAQELKDIHTKVTTLKDESQS